MKRADIVLIVVILAVSFLGFFGLRQVSESYYLEIIFDGERIHYEEITKASTFNLVIERIGRIEIQIEAGVVDVVSATANPNQICVYAAPISQDSWNPNIICAPNRLTIRIIGGAPIVDVLI